jgi:hypothetical protein
LALRRKGIRRSTSVFGLDFVELCPVEGESSPPRRFRLHFLGRKPDSLSAEQIDLRRTGSTCRLAVRIVVPARKQGWESRIEIELLEEVTSCVDYTLTLDLPAVYTPSLDPFFASLTFQFERTRIATVDCLPAPPAVEKTPLPPEINYLAKDYPTFRQLILDRLAVTMPDWQDHYPADIGVMLVEVIAYIADHLSYYQDAVATEAYLGTARHRQSLRRHARLIDYRVHEGCNARTWVFLEVDSDVLLESPHDLFFVAFPGSPEPPGQAFLSSDALDRLTQAHPDCVIFELVISHPSKLWHSHNDCGLYDWHGARPCLEKGATSAFLVNRAQDNGSKAAVPSSATLPDESSSAKPAAQDQWLHFRKGDLLLFEELRDPWTGNTADANPNHRHVVRIKSVDASAHDQLFDVPLVKITWDEADALPFTLWISRPHDAHWESGPDQPVSIARGNILLADQGRRAQENVQLTRSHDDPPESLKPNYPPAKVRAHLKNVKLTFCDRLAGDKAPATSQLKQDPRRAVPQLILQEKRLRKDVLGEFSLHELRDQQSIARRILAHLFDAKAGTLRSLLPRAARCARQLNKMCGNSDVAQTREDLSDLERLRTAIQDDLREIWLPQYDLIESGPADSHFVVEMSDARDACFRFGQGGFGRAPDLDDDPGRAEMVADYRIGNGAAGNLAAEAIGLFGTRGQSTRGIISVRNPLPSVGGTDPESSDEVRLYAPHAIRTRQRRAITADDYATIVMREFAGPVQQAKAVLRWTGHEWEVLVAIDARGREVAPARLLFQIRSALYRYRRIGHHVVVRAAERVVPVLELTACIGPHVIKDDVVRDLNELFSDRILRDGSLAFFHPDRVTFGDGVFISQIVAAAKNVAGMIHLEVTQLHRQGGSPAGELESGLLPLRPLEIVRFVNDPGHPELGVLDLKIEGGR